MSSARLPQEFVERMRALLGPELPRFVASFDEPRTRALRVNPQKTDAGELAELLGVELRPLPWSPLGFELDGNAPPLGSHPAHLAGLFYLQEPSALVVAELAGASPGARVADVAAAPGGKTTHLATLVGERGVVVANEVVPGRLRTLRRNLERWGAGNVVATQLPLERLAAAVEEPFDAVVLDAPCTGEALFRRDPRLVREWSPAAVRGSARRQSRLLRDAASLVRPGGVLVYSTCSFEPEENEQVVARFLAEAHGWSLEDAVAFDGLAPGCRLDGFPTERTARLWPHEAPGEGQFAARLRLSAEAEPAVGSPAAVHRRDHRGDVLGAWRDFAERVAPELAHDDRLVVAGDSVVLAPECPPGVAEDVLVARGTLLGTARPGRFEPAQALATSALAQLVRPRVAWAAGDPRLQAYLRGEAVRSPGPDGWVLVGFERWGLGWARRSGGVLKNLLPRPLRRRS